MYKFICVVSAKTGEPWCGGIGLAELLHDRENLLERLHLAEERQEDRVHQTEDRVHHAVELLEGRVHRAEQLEASNREEEAAKKAADARQQSGRWPLPGAMGIQPNGALNKLHFDIS